MNRHQSFSAKTVAPSLVLLTIGLMLTGCQRPPTATLSPEATVAAVEPGTTTGTGATTFIYKDPQASVAARVEDLLSRMTVAEKIGQMTQVEKNSIQPTDITAWFIGSLLSGGGGHPTPNNAENWANMIDGFQEYALKTRLAIPLVYGADGVHGHGNVVGATVFPQNIGLGASRDPDLVQRIGHATAEEMAATGVRWNFGPVVAVPQDIRWGRTYEGYSEDAALVSELASAYIHGLQDVGGTRTLRDPTAVLATPKHYVGDGGTKWGSSTAVIEKPYMLDQGVTDVDEATLRAIHLRPYKAAVDAGALSIMVSFSSWGGLKMHAQKYLLTDVLKGELGFEGFVVSDWGGIDQIPGDYYSDVVTSINAGVDMVMVPYDYNTFINDVTQAVKKGDISPERIDDAIRRILNVKFQLGLFEQPLVDRSQLAVVGSEEHRQLAREAVAKSAVLLKNDDETLPLSKDTPLIFLGGQAADDIGIQCGGWTIEWQGKAGEITDGTTIREAIESTISASTGVHYSRFGKFDRVTDAGDNPAIADVGIAVVGEMPYAEGEGDRAELALSEADVSLIQRMRERSKKLVIILISGRPMIITDELSLADAFVAAWLPGTEGQGVADVLFGDVPFTGKLPYTWPRSMDQLPSTNLAAAGPEAALFPFGFGLAADGTHLP